MTPEEEGSCASSFSETWQPIWQLDNALPTALKLLTFSFFDFSENFRSARIAAVKTVTHNQRKNRYLFTVSHQQRKERLVKEKKKEKIKYEDNKGMKKRETQKHYLQKLFVI